MDAWGELRLTEMEKQFGEETWVHLLAMFCVRPIDIHSSHPSRDIELAVGCMRLDFWERASQRY